ncbi:MAG: hypothetical protein AAFQ42_15315, partial [Pseudomonadota bacterium]
SSGDTLVSKVGRPTVYTPELADEICQRLSEGESLIQIMRDDHMPARSQIYAWLKVHPEFQDNYVRAREEQTDHFAEQTIVIADEEPDPVKARVQIDARKWAAAQMNPGKYAQRKIVDDGPERSARKAAAGEHLARICELAAKCGSADPAAASRGAASSEGADEFPVLRQKH